MSTTAERATPLPATGGDGGLTHRQILTVLSGLLLGLLLAALDQTIVSAAMRTIADQLHGQTMQAWGTTAYLITSTITTPLYGKLSDIYGRKPFFITAISLFLVGSALSGMSQSMYELAAFRAVQGLGAGGLFSLALAIIGDMVSPRERGRYQGYFLAVFGLASVLGPVVGGFFAGLDSFLGVTGWRWVFLVNLPIGLVALTVVSKVLNLPHRRIDHRVDYLGALTLVVGVVPLLIVAEQGREWGWASGRSLAMFAIGAIGLLAFVFTERRMRDEALLPLRLFRSSVFSLANVLNFIVGMGMFGGMASLPLYLQIVKGYTPTQSGLLLLPLMVGIMAASILSGQVIARTGRYRVFPIIGTGAMAGALFLFSRIGMDTPLGPTLLTALLMGFGLGLCMQTLVLAVQNDVPPGDMGVATASATFFRQMGGTAGTAVFLSILFGVVADRIAGAFRAATQTTAFQSALQDPAVLADPNNQVVLKALRSGGANADLNNTSFIEHLDPRLARPFLDGFSSAMDTVFMVGGVVMIVGFLLVWFLKEQQLSSKSGMQRRAEDAAVRATVPALD
jgi:EmrB/QacA subfamily drug resistance transporter